jgi:hypothetical protein
LVYSHTTSGPGWLIPNKWYEVPSEELVEDMKYNFREQAGVQVVSEGEL